MLNPASDVHWQRELSEDQIGHLQNVRFMMIFFKKKEVKIIIVARVKSIADHTWSITNTSIKWSTNNSDIIAFVRLNKTFDRFHVCESGDTGKRQLNSITIS